MRFVRAPLVPAYASVDWVLLLIQGTKDEQITAGFFASGEYYGRA